MTERNVDLSDLVLSGKGGSFSLDELISEITFTWSSEQVAEMALSSHDVGNLLAETDLGRLGSTITCAGQPWQVAAVEADYQGGNVDWTFRARSALARKLRRKITVSAEKLKSPSQWVTTRVKKAGGTAICQTSATGGTIAQGKDQTDLDIIGDLAGQLGWSWVEWGNTFVFGSRRWAWKSGVPGFPTYALTWGTDEKTDAMSASASQSEDDTAAFAVMDVTVPHAFGKILRPWYRLNATGFGRFDGVWLIDSVSLRRDGVSPVEVQLVLPRKAIPQPSTSSGSATGTATPGTPRATAVAFALNEVGKPYTNPGNPPTSWDCSKLTAAAWGAAGISLTPLTFTQVNECTTITEAQLLPGDLVFYFRDAHHVSMYIGGGQIVEAASPSSGVRVASLHNSWNDAHFSSYGRPKGASST